MTRSCLSESDIEELLSSSLSLPLSLFFPLSLLSSSNIHAAKAGWDRAPTVEREFAFHRVPPLSVLRCALVDPRVLLLEVRDL